MPFDLSIDCHDIFFNSFMTRIDAHSRLLLSRRNEGGLLCFEPYEIMGDDAGTTF